MKLIQIARTDYPTVSPRMDIIGCARLMREYDLRLLPVVEAGGLVGVISITDIVFRSIADGVDWFLARVSDFMTKDPVVCDGESTPPQALSLIQTIDLAALPIVDGEGAYRGIVFRDDLLKRIGRFSRPAPPVRSDEAAELRPRLAHPQQGRMS